MKKWLKALSLLLLVVVSYAGLLASEVFPRPRPEERAAMDILRQPLPPVSGRSAFSVMWLMGRDVRGQDVDSLMQRDVEALAAARDGGDFTSAAAGLPAIPLIDEPACAGFPEPCLADLRSRADQGAGLAEQYSLHLANSEALLQAGHYRYPFSLADELQVPRVGHVVNLRRFANARLYLGVSAADGLAATCRELEVWRRLRPTADILIHQMIAIAFAQTQAGLLAEMLAEWPADQPLPASCADALAPLAPAELEQCDAWRGEFAWLERNVEGSRGQPYPNAEVKSPAWFTELLVNRRSRIAYSAIQNAEGCPGYQAAGSREIRWVDWAFDPLGALQEEFHGPQDLAKYRRRFDQYLDVLRTLRAQAWLRTQADPAQAWKQLPPDMRPGGHSLRYDPGRRELTMGLSEPGPDGPDRWTISLPPPLPARPPAG